MHTLYQEIQEKTDELKSLIGYEEEKDICPLNICDGSGEVSDYEYDNNVHLYYVSGTKPCPCQHHDE